MEFPYEYLPLPEKGEEVPTGNRFGEHVGMGRVHDIKNLAKNDGTTLVTLEIPKEQLMEVRTIYRGDING